MEVSFRQRLSKVFRSPLTITVLIVLGATLWLYQPVLRGEVPLPTKSIFGYTWGKPDGQVVQSIFRDRIVQAYPYHLFAAREIQQGNFPWWNDLIFAGTTFFANGQAGLYSLIKLPFWWLPPIDSFILVTLAQSVVAALGFALLVRQLRWRPLAGVLMALTFTLSAPFVMRMTVTTMSAVFAFLPFVLWAILRLHERLTWRRVTVVSACIAATIFAGHVQLAAFALGLAVIWTGAWWRRPQVGRRIVMFIVAFSLGLGLTSIQLVPIKDVLSQAYRQPNEMSWSKILTPTRFFQVNKRSAISLASMIDPQIFGTEQRYHGPANILEANFFIGPIALLLILASLWAWRTRLWKILAAVAVVEVGVFIFPRWWDFIGKFAPWITVTPVWRTSFVLAFTLALFVGLGVQAAPERWMKRFGWWVAGGFVVLAMMQWRGVLPFEPRSTLFPPSAMLTKAHELTSDGSRVWMPNGALDELMVYDVPISVGYDSVYAQSYLDLWRANSEKIAKRNQLVPINPNGSVLGVTASNTMITSDPLPTGWTSVMTEGKWTLAKRDRPTDPVHAVARLIVADGPAVVGTIDPATEATVTGDAPAIDVGAKPAVSVSGRSRTNLVVTVTTAGQTVLVTNLQHYTGWHLNVDGQRADEQALVVNHAFQGAVVGTGTHVVEFVYAPESFAIGAWLSLLSVTALIALAWFTNEKNKTTAQPSSVT